MKLSSAGANQGNYQGNDQSAAPSSAPTSTPSLKQILTLKPKTICHFNGGNVLFEGIKLERMKFDDYKIADELKESIRNLGFKRPTDIQFKSIQPILSGDDVLAIAQTGTGKQLLSQFQLSIF